MNVARYVLSLALAASACLGLAQPVTYATKTKSVQAGVLLVASQVNGGQLYNPTPHVWGQLDRDTRVKPAGLSFDNPIGQTTLTAAAAQRWGMPANSFRHLTKRDAPYWEVVLGDVSESTLAQFDVLSLTVRNGLSLTPSEREKLRRFVDQGGILWIDLWPSGAFGIDPANSGPVLFTTASDNGNLFADLGNQLLRYPNALNTTDINYLRDPSVAQTLVLALPTTSVNQVMADFTEGLPRMGNVVATSAGGVVGLARIGSGSVVITTRGVTANLNRGFDPNSPGSGWSANTGFTSLLPPNDNWFSAAAKFAFNLVNLSSDFNSQAGGARRSNSVRRTVPAPLIERFKVGGSYTSLNTPAVAKGKVVVTSGSRIAAFLANPSEGTPANATDPYVQLWPTVDAGATLSSPVIVDVPNTTLGDTEQIWVLGSDDTLRVFSLKTGTLLKSISAPAGGTVPFGTPFAPAVHENFVVVADKSSSDSSGRLWAVSVIDGENPGSTSNPWLVKGVGSLFTPTATPTVGYIPIRDNSNGADRVVYTAMDSDPANNRPCGISSTWLSTRGESPGAGQVSRTGSQVTINLRAKYTNLPVLLGSSPFGLHVTALRANGAPLTQAEMETYFTNTVIQPSPGTVELSLSAAGVASGLDWDGKATTNPADDIGFRIDYTIDWSQSSTVDPRSYVRGNLNFVDNSLYSRKVIGSPALGTDGHIGVTVSTTTNAGVPGGTFYNLVESGRGVFDVKTRYDLYSSISTGFNVLGQGNVTYPPCVTDEDDLVKKLLFLGGSFILDTPITRLRFASAPAVIGDTMYCVASGVKTVFGQGVPTSVVFAFKANPDPVQFEVESPAPAAGQPEPLLTIQQPDLARSLNQANPTAFSAVVTGGSKVSLNRSPGSSRVRVTLDSLTASSNGTMSSCISTNLPLVIKRGTTSTDQLVQPEASATWTYGGANFTPGYAAGKFSHLQWYTVLNGYAASTGPLVTGQTMFIGGASILPGLLVSGVPSFPLPTNGLIYGIDSQIAGNDPYLFGNSLKPWENQLYAVKGVVAPNSFVGVSIDPAFRWPQTNGMEDVSDFRTRILQATLPDPVALTMGAGGDVLSVLGQSTLHAFSRSEFLVADAGRIGRWDANGNPLWTTDTTLSAGPRQPVTNANNLRPLSDPVRVYPADSNGYWVVDAGSDQVIKIDAAGRELRTINRLRLHPQRVPAGMVDNESLSLRNPRDIATFTDTKSIAEVAALFPGEVLRQAPTPERWDHVLVADSGNNRVIEVVDRYRLDSFGRVLGPVRYKVAGGVPDDEGDGYTTAQSVIVWHTPEEFSGKLYSYNSIGRVDVGSGAGRHTVFAFGFGNIQPGKVTVGLDGTGQDVDRHNGFGGIVLYDGGNTEVIKQFTVAGAVAGQFLGENPPGSGTYSFNLPSTNQDEHVDQFAGLRSTTVRYVDMGGTPTIAIMVTVSSGVYEIVKDTSNPGAPVWRARWMLPKEAYVGMRRPRTAGPYSAADLSGNPAQFRPTYARRLESGDVLIVNNYFGTKFGSNAEFNGEVVLVDGSFASGATGPLDPGFGFNRPNLGFTATSVKFELPPVSGTRGLVSPVFAERQ
ncbi:MAG: hypothetical protein KF857_07675 [Fimbriimonadaceae bacterium]|nr:hypothetical protein [Fimbriimonadaceae bacterium]